MNGQFLILRAIYDRPTISQRDLAKKYSCNFFIVTDGSSAIFNKGNGIVEKHRRLQIELDKEMGINPFDNWESE